MVKWSCNEWTWVELMGAELTAVILTYNEEKHIKDCIKSLAWADRVVVFDSVSEDKTVPLAEGLGAEILQAPFNNYAEQRNRALDGIETDWVFFVDADERGYDEAGSMALAEEVRRVISERPEHGWYIPRYNYIFGKRTGGAGWYPDYQLRLFKHGFVRYERPVHEVALVDGEIGHLQTPLVHYNYADVPHFHRTQRAYSNYEASILKEEGVRPRPHNFLLQPLRQFYWRYVTLKGYSDGWHGLRLSSYMGYYEWIKYRKLAALWQGEA